AGAASGSSTALPGTVSGDEVVPCIGAFGWPDPWLCCTGAAVVSGTARETDTITLDVKMEFRPGWESSVRSIVILDEEFPFAPVQTNETHEHWSKTDGNCKYLVLNLRIVAPWQILTGQAMLEINAN